MARSGSYSLLAPCVAISAILCSLTQSRALPVFAELMKRSGVDSVVAIYFCIGLAAIGLLATQTVLASRARPLPTGRQRACCGIAAVCFAVGACLLAFGAFAISHGFDGLATSSFVAPDKFIDVVG